MKNLLRHSLFTLGGVVVGLAGFYLYSQAATTDSVTVTVSVPGTLSIADDGNALTFNLTPNVIDTSNSTALTVGSNSGSGFAVTAEIADLDSTTGQLCDDDGGACGTLIFDADGNTSYISVQSEATGGTLDGTFLNAETKLGAAPVQVYSDIATENLNTFTVTYDGFADLTITSADYKGSITFTISSL